MMLPVAVITVAALGWGIVIFVIVRVGLDIIRGK